MALIFHSESGLPLPLIEPKVVAYAHERWYAAQPATKCQRCDREFPNDGKTNYCSRDCELGFFPEPQPPKRGKYKVPTHKKHLPIGSFRSNWS